MKKLYRTNLCNNILCNNDETQTSGVVLRRTVHRNLPVWLLLPSLASNWSLSAWHTQVHDVVAKNTHAYKHWSVLLVFHGKSTNDIRASLHGGLRLETSVLGHMMKIIATSKSYLFNAWDQLHDTINECKLACEFNSCRCTYERPVYSILQSW